MGSLSREPQYFLSSRLVECDASDDQRRALNIAFIPGGIQTMKRIAVVVLLTSFVAASAEAASNVKNSTPEAASKAKYNVPHFGNSIGINLGLDNNGVVGLQGEFDISSWLEAPIALQVFWKNYAKPYTIPSGTYRYQYVGIGLAGIYDFSSLVNLGEKIKPYAGFGLVDLIASPSGPPDPAVVDSGGLYITAGFRYVLSPKLAADMNYNNLGGLTVGAILKF
jgi:hypothetical protein